MGTITVNRTVPDITSPSYTTLCLSLITIHFLSDFQTLKY